MMTGGGGVLSNYGDIHIKSLMPPWWSALGSILTPPSQEEEDQEEIEMLLG